MEEVSTAQRRDSNPEEASEVPEHTEVQQPTTAKDEQPPRTRDYSDKERENLLKAREKDDQLKANKLERSGCFTCLKYTFCCIPMCCCLSIGYCIIKCSRTRMCWLSTFTNVNLYLLYLFFKLFFIHWAVVPVHYWIPLLCVYQLSTIKWQLNHCSLQWDRYNPTFSKSNLWSTLTRRLRDTLLLWTRSLPALHFMNTGLYL